jgi:hypothetical protein
MGVNLDAGIVADPVGHISISGVHGKDELNQRLANRSSKQPRRRPLLLLLIGAAVGATVMYLLKL